MAIQRVNCHDLCMAILNIIMDRYRKIIVLSLKIGIGSSLALYIAESIGLDYAVSAGTITLLTLMTSKWETVKLSVCRLATFTMTVLIAWQVFSHVKSTWISYGILLAIIVFIAEIFEWRSTISVNGVIAAHLVTNRNFSDTAIWNEFLLILIGIIFAVLLFQLMEEEELPETHEEFANRALVYHILRDIEDFLKYKIHFIKELDETQLKVYWKR
ncbi:MAG: aromatic acid exporter family protein [Oliverpabstia sp.]